MSYDGLLKSKPLAGCSNRQPQQNAPMGSLDKLLREVAPMGCCNVLPGRGALASCSDGLIR